MGILGGLILKPSGIANILLTNLLSYYNFDESSGDLLDIHGSQDFTLFGPTQGASGLINDSYSFDGSNDFCTANNAAPWDLTTTDYSISFWFKRSGGIGLNNYLLDYRDANNDGLLIFLIGSTDRLFISHGSTDFSGSVITDTTTWHNVIISADRDVNATVYLDGESEGTFGASADLNISVKPKLGARSFSTPSNYLNGLMDEFGVWNRVLTSDEVALLYNSGAGLSYNNFV